MTSSSAAGSPSITVLMTVYNAGRFLDPAIRSIAGQVFRDWEFVIVDDGSTDGSLEVIRAWAERDPRIRLLANPVNQGQTASLNEGLRAARGRWIARQDADDLSHPLRLTRQFERVTIQPELVLLGTCGRMIDEHDRFVGLLDAPAGPDAIEWSSPFLNPFMHTSVLFRTDLVRDTLGGYDESYRIAQDYELWTRILADHPSANLTDRLVCYRHLGTSLSKAGRERAFAEARQVSDREADRIFSRRLSERERDLLAAFREGLTPANRRAFWTLYGDLQGPHPSRDLRGLAALHHLKAAGAMMAAPTSLAAEIGAAFRSDVGTTLGWLGERFLRK